MSGPGYDDANVLLDHASAGVRTVLDGAGSLCSCLLGHAAVRAEQEGHPARGRSFRELSRWNGGTVTREYGLHDLDVVSRHTTTVANLGSFLTR